MSLSPKEQEMWEVPEQSRRHKMSDHKIEEKYEQGEQRIVTEVNREKLPNFVQSLKKPNHINVRPFYQRRLRWDKKRQSRLIESFIMNIPVPPVFLYERAFNQYEVMDGQQRITALSSFYDNSFKLGGLESWPELNGRTYKTLPPKVRDGLDRRSISSIVLLKESAPDDESALLLKRIVFERLNTGGVKLGRQEIRNCLFQGRLNKQLLRMSDFSPFRIAWGIPDIELRSDGSPPDELLENTMFTKMEDIELVLRFLALRHLDHFRGGLQGFLDRYMIRGDEFGDDDFAFLNALFEKTVLLCTELYGNLVFRAYDPKTDEWAKRPHKSFSDAVMVGVSRHLEHSDLLRNRKADVIKATKQLFCDHLPKTFTGFASTKDDVKNRISLYEQMLTSIVGL